VLALVVFKSEVDYVGHAVAYAEVFGGSGYGFWFVVYVTQDH
jgi:hypothetical protein